MRLECRIGFLVNPIAGMGGSVGLKGTDGTLLDEAVKRGAKPVAPSRALRFLLKLREVRPDNLVLVSAGGVMGCDYVAKVSPGRFICLEEPRREKTTKGDTIGVVRELLKLDVQAIAFVGGDGTARDVLEACGPSIPIIGIPSGVKVYSSVFAVSPEAASKIVADFCRGEAKVEVGDVVDVNEEMLCRDILVLKPYGRALTISSEGLRVSTKELGGLDDVEGIAEYFATEIYKPRALYILGPGSTTKAIAARLGVDKTLLGFDAIYNGELVMKDLTAKDIQELIDRYKEFYVVLSIIGGQGYLIGRGNQQLTPEILRVVGRERIIIVSTKSKLARLKRLLIDSGDVEVDRKLSGYYRVITGYGEVSIIKAVPASELETLST